MTNNPSVGVAVLPATQFFVPLQYSIFKVRQYAALLENKKDPEPMIHANNLAETESVLFLLVPDENPNEERDPDPN